MTSDLLRAAKQAESIEDPTERARQVAAIRELARFSLEIEALAPRPPSADALAKARAHRAARGVDKR